MASTTTIPTTAAHQVGREPQKAIVVFTDRNPVALAHGIAQLLALVPLPLFECVFRLHRRETFACSKTFVTSCVGCFLVELKGDFQERIQGSIFILATRCASHALLPRALFIPQLQSRFAPMEAS